LAVKGIFISSLYDDRQYIAGLIYSSVISWIEKYFDKLILLARFKITFSDISFLILSNFEI
jgi:hypothetical protein